METMNKQGKLALRVYVMFGYFSDAKEIDDVISALDKTGIKTGFGNDRLKFGEFKIMAGNSRGSRTCWLQNPYVGSSYEGKNYYGIPHPLLSPEPAKIDDVVLAAHKAGLQIGIHLQGDREISRGLEAIEKALKQYPRADHRHRIEHGSFWGRDTTMLAYSGASRHRNMMEAAT